MCLFSVGCSVERGGQKFDVPHGDFFIYVDDDDDDDSSDSDDNNECQRCLCSNGEPTLCEAANCTAVKPFGCSYQGQSYNHGDTFDVSLMQNTNSCVAYQISRERVAIP